MAKNQIQFFFILSARTLDAVVLFIIYPKLFHHFGLEFAKVSQFMSIASVVVITVKLGFDSVIILKIKEQMTPSDNFIQSVFWTKLILTFPTIFFAALYNFYIQSLIETWLLVLLVSFACLSEVFNFSQLTLINKNALWVFSFNLAKVCILLAGVEVIISYLSLEAFLWLHVALLVIVAAAHFLLNRVYKIKLFQVNMMDILFNFNCSLNFFILRLYSLMSDKLVLMFSISSVSKFEFIILELFIKFVALFAVPTFILFNFVRSRSLPINAYVLIISLFFLSAMSGLCFFSYVHFFDYLTLSNFSEENLLFVSFLLSVTVLFSQTMIYVSDFSAIRPDRKTGSKFLNCFGFCVPLFTFLFVDQSSMYLSIFILNVMFVIGILSYTMQNFIFRHSE